MVRCLHSNSSIASGVGGINGDEVENWAQVARVGLYVSCRIGRIDTVVRLYVKVTPIRS